MGKMTDRELAKMLMPVLNKNPSASMEEMADAISIGRATLFRRFGTRAGLIRTLIQESLNDSRDIMLPILERDMSAEDKLKAMAAGLQPLAASFSFLVYEPWQLEDPETRRADALYRELWEKVVMQWRDEGRLAEGVPIAWAARALDSLLWTAWLSASKGEIALNDVPELILGAFQRISATPAPSARR